MSLAEKEIAVMVGADDVKAALGEMGVVTTGMGIADYGDAIRSISVGCPALPDLVAGGTYKKTDNTPVVISAISGETSAIRLLVAATGPMKTALVLTFTGSPVINWGDGTTTSPTSGTAAVHQYDGVNPIPCGRPYGVYLITVTGGTVTAVASGGSRTDWGSAIGNIVSVAIKSVSVATVQTLLRSLGVTVNNYMAEYVYYDAPITDFSYSLLNMYLIRSAFFKSSQLTAFASFAGAVASGLSTMDLRNARVNGDFTASVYLANCTSILFNSTNTELGNINIQQNSLSTAAFVALFNSLPTVTSKTLQIGGSAAALALSAEQIAIATAKGWTVTRTY